MSLIDRLKNNPINKLISIMGIDKAIFLTIMLNFWQIIAGVISIFFIVAFLTIEQQGYWFTFLSLGALTLFAELGFTTIVTQFISHEYAHLKEKNGLLIGDSERIARTISLIRFSLKFYFIIVFVAFILLVIVGLLFLEHSTQDLNLLLAWVFYSSTGSFLLLISLIGSILKGFNQVSKVQKIILTGTCIGNIGTWIALYAGFNLWALAIGSFVNIFISLILFYYSSNSLWKQLIFKKIEGKFNWFKETIPLQWRYALSWGSGYLIFQFMVPVTQFYAGAAIAGQLGLTLTIVRALQTMASSWGMTKVPQFNMLVAQSKHDKLNSLFKQVQWQSIGIYIIGSIMLIIMAIYLFPLIGWSSRVLPTYIMAILLLAEFGHLIVFNMAYYLRSFKQEPYMQLSVITAITISLAIWASMYFYNSIILLVSSYCIITLISLVPALIIFIKKKR